MQHANLPFRVFLNFMDFCNYRNNKTNKHEPPNDKAARSVVLYDRACPLCRAEMQRLQARDRAGRLLLVDISAPGFEAVRWGFSQQALANALHVLTSDNQWLIGMPAIRHVYAQVGLAWLMAPTGWPVLANLADLAYRYVAPNRIVLSRWLGLAPAATVCADTQCDATQQPGRSS
jgi:predicted DCC family thiol-disulfide oxidoreductase YuxK